MRKTKQLILAVILLITTITQAQKSLFDNISEENQYHVYRMFTESEEGFFTSKTRLDPVKFKKEYLPTGEGYKLTAITDEGTDKGDVFVTSDVSSKGNSCVGYPYESHIHGTYSYVSIDNYVFVLGGLSKDKTSFKTLNVAFIKIERSAKDKAKKKDETKSKKSFFAQIKALKNQAQTASGHFGSEYKELEGKNIRKMITDYLVAMKAKQNGRTATQKKSDKNIANIAVAKKAAKDAVWAEAKRYNDSVKATPEWQELDRRKKLNEANYQGAQKANIVTLRNTSANTIYVANEGSKNRGTKINAGGSAKWNCDQDAFIQVNNTTTNTKVYSKNTGCGNTIIVR